MGKRGRKQKKETKTSKMKSVPVPDKSPRICDERPSFSEFKTEVKSPQLLAKDDTSSKITDYFPKSPESRSKPVQPPSSVQSAMDQDTLNAVAACIPPPSLLTPESTPTKENAHPAPSPLSNNFAPSSQHPTANQDTRSKPAGRPKAAQKLNYTRAAKTVEDEARDDGMMEVKMGGVTSDEAGAKTEGGKSSRRGRRAKNTKQNKQVQSPVTTLKDFFPVRRSNRRCKSAIQAEEMKMLHQAVLSGQEEGMEVQNILGKGRGVVATRAYKKGDFVVEYHGEHIDIVTAKQREQEYAANPSVGCYMYYYQYKNKPYCVDATAESGRIGRLLNHSKSGNCTTKLISIADPT